jgi:hypothetical protein
MKSQLKKHQHQRNKLKLKEKQLQNKKLKPKHQQRNKLKPNQLKRNKLLKKRHQHQKERERKSNMLKLLKLETLCPMSMPIWKRPPLKLREMPNKENRLSHFLNKNQTLNNINSVD